MYSALLFKHRQSITNSLITTKKHQRDVSDELNVHTNLQQQTLIKMSLIKLSSSKHHTTTTSDSMTLTSKAGSVVRHHQDAFTVHECCVGR